MTRERYTDPLDAASALTDETNAAHIARVRDAARPEQVRNQDGTWPQTDCEECGEEIERGRLEQGYIRCIACARYAEQQRKLYAKR